MGTAVPEVAEAITKVALKYSLLSAYTSFVAIDEKGRPTRHALSKK